MDELLPFLFAIGYVLYTFYKRANKKKERQKPAQPQGEDKKSESDDVKRMLEEILMGKEEKPAYAGQDKTSEEEHEENYQETVAVEEDDTTFVEADDARNYEAYNQNTYEILDSIPEEPEAKSLEVLEQEEKKKIVMEKAREYYSLQPSDGQSWFTFDARLAFVYSEIFQRKHFKI